MSDAKGWRQWWRDNYRGVSRDQYWAFFRKHAPEGHEAIEPHGLSWPDEEKPERGALVCFCVNGNYFIHKDARP